MSDARYSLTGKSAIITGGSRGLGKEIAIRYVESGANVCICSRNGKELSEAIEEIRKRAKNVNTKVVGIKTDISKDEDVDALFDYAENVLGRVDIIVNNAGIQGEIGLLEDADWDNWKRTVEVNLFGTVNCMRHAVKKMSCGKSGGKIINISGGGATGSRPYFSAYAAAKTAIVRMTEVIADEAREYNIDINAIAPGAMNTAMTKEVLDLGEKVAGEKEYGTAQKTITKDDSVKERASELALYLASDVSNGITGKLFSAVWDDWEHMHEHKDEVVNGNLYTLRRIVP